MSTHGRDADRDTDLARLLGEAVGDVEPADRLDEIRARTSNAAPQRRWWYAGGAALAAAAAVTAVAVLGPGTTPTSAPDPAEQPSATPSDAAEERLEDALVATYWLGETPQGPRLYQEMAQVEVGRDETVLSAAIRAVVEGRPKDPDYQPGWPGTRVESVEQDADGSVSVLLERRPGAGEREPLAAAQVAHTAWGVLGDRVTVSIEAAGPGDEFIGTGVEPGPESDDLAVLALVSISDPAEGEQVEGTFTARGRASSFEATVPWEVRDDTGAVVLDGFSTAEGWMERLYPWEAEVDVSGLEPGRYTFVAMTSDPSDGESGGPMTDTRTIVVP